MTKARSSNPEVTAHLLETPSYGQLASNRPSRFSPIEALAATLDRWLLPENGGNSEAGKEVIRQVSGGKGPARRSGEGEKREESMKSGLQATIAGIIAFAIIGVMLFLPTGTFNYWQAWVLLAVFTISSIVPVIYLGLKNPAALQRRMQGGPTAETRTAQKYISSVTILLLPAVMVFSAFDHRLGWSPVPGAVSVIGDALVALGIILTTLVVVQNNYAAANIAIETGQKVTTTGLYGLVRHPMYVGVLITMLGIPLALGSWWGLAVLIPDTLAFILRIFDEEKMLKQGLDGYSEYMQKVPYRLIPYVW